MTEQEKQLLFKDLCARLPYNIIVNVDNGKYREDVKLRPCHFESFERWDIKPYLRPVSDLTFEEFKKIHLDGDILYNADDKIVISESWETVDYMNEIMIDYRDLIGKGLALKAPEGMYK